MTAVFDGHNDVLTRADHGGIATGRPDGHLNLPRMREGGVRGGIFAVCVQSPDPFERRVAREDDVIEFALSDPASRNLTDGQLDAIGASGGLVGIVFACPFLRPDFADVPDTPLALIAQHAAYVAELLGAAHVALGSDFDGATIPDELGDVAGIPRLLDALTDVGFSAAEMEAIAWGNWRRVLGEWWESDGGGH